MTEQIFRQGTTERITTAFITYSGVVIPQPVGLPTVEIIFINDNLKPESAIARMVMTEYDVGRYFYDWNIPIDQPTTEHQIIYKGIIDGRKVIGEDTVTILPIIVDCPVTPVNLDNNQGCGC